RLVPVAGTRRMPRGTTPLAAGLSAGGRSAAADTASRAHGRVPPASTADADPPHPGRAGARGGWSPGGSAPAPPGPARPCRTDPRQRVPVVAGTRMVHAGVPDRTRTSVRLGPGERSRSRRLRIAG